MLVEALSQYLAHAIKTDDSESMTGASMKT